MQEGNNPDPVGKETRIDPPGAGQVLTVQPYLLNPANTNMMFYPGATHVWRNLNVTLIPKFSNQTSQGWLAMPVTEGTSIVTAMEMSTRPPNRLYYARKKGQLFRLDDAVGAESHPEGHLERAVSGRFHRVDQ